jgi:hypothetical protein
MSQTRARDQDLRLESERELDFESMCGIQVLKPLLTLSSQAFPTELERNPPIYLPTMNSTRIRLKHRKGSVMITRRDTTGA